MADYRRIRFERFGPVVRIVLHRPERVNALSDEMVGEIKGALAALDTDTRCLLLTGAGTGFSSGADLTEGTGDDGGLPDLGDILRKRYNPLMRTLQDLKVPIVASVNGPAVGAGMSLALAADLVIAARSAYFTQGFIRIGLAPDAGSTWYLPRLVGAARAREMMMLGEPVPAKRAVEWGLIHKAVDDDSLEAESMALAQRLAQGPTKALVAIRRLCAAALSLDLDAQLEMEARAQSVIGRTEDFRAGVTAFLTKSAPDFRGR